MRQSIRHIPMVELWQLVQNDNSEKIRLLTMKKDVFVLLDEKNKAKSEQEKTEIACGKDGFKDGILEAD